MTPVCWLPTPVRRSCSKASFRPTRPCHPSGLPTGSAGSISRLTKGGAEAGRAHATDLAWLIGQVEAGALSGSNGKQVFERHFGTGEPAAAIVAELGLRQITDSSALAEVIERVLAANPAAVADVRAGKPQAIKFLVGQVMRETRGQAKADTRSAAARGAPLVTLNVGLWLVGVVMLGVGVWRIRAPFTRMTELDRLAENSKRYDSWRGNRAPEGDRTTGADVMREMLRRQVIVWGAVAAIGVALIVAGFAVR